MRYFSDISKYYRNFFSGSIRIRPSIDPQDYLLIEHKGEIYAVEASKIFDNAVQLTGNQTINGIKTFIISPVIPDPSNSNQATNKSYVDTQVSDLNDNVVHKTGNESIADTKTFNDAITLSRINSLDGGGVSVYDTNGVELWNFLNNGRLYPSGDGTQDFGNPLSRIRYIWATGLGLYDRLMYVEKESIGTSIAASGINIYVSLDSTGGAFAPTTPLTANLLDGQIIIWKDDGGAATISNITITASSGQTIDGASTYVIATNYGSITTRFDIATGNHSIISKVSI